MESEIKKFERWHYKFDFGNVSTTVFKKDNENRHKQRAQYFFNPLKQAGMLKGKRVLDLACNAGFYSLLAVEAGCEHVVGVDARQMHVDQANLVFKFMNVAPGKYKFIKANVFEFDFPRLGEFDVVLCLGLFYHIAKPMELFEIINSVNTEIIVIDTALALSKGSTIEVRHEPTLDDPLMAADYTLVFHPTASALMSMAEQFNYNCVMLKPEFEDWSGCDDYRDGYRRAFILIKENVAELEKDDECNVL